MIYCTIGVHTDTKIDFAKEAVYVGKQAEEIDSRGDGTRREADI